MKPFRQQAKIIIISIVACLFIVAGVLAFRNRDAARGVTIAAVSNAETQTAATVASATASASQAADDFATDAVAEPPRGHGGDHPQVRQPAPEQQGADNPAARAAFVAALAQARKGGPFSFALPDGTRVSGTVNVVTVRPDGTRYVGGMLDGWKRASFFFSLDSAQRVGGEVLVFDTGRAFVLGAGSGAAGTDESGTGSAGSSDARWQEKPLGDVICYPFPRSPASDEDAQAGQTATVSAAGANAGAAAGATPSPRAAPVPSWESKPGAVVVLFLDFNGAIIEGSYWNTGGNTIVAPPSTLSDTQALNVWQRVSEDYSPFNVNVTTDASVYARAANKRRVHCIITPDNSWYGPWGGVTRINSLGMDSDMYPCWVFNTDLDGVAEAASHEIGHTFNLQHHGQNPPTSNSSSDGAYYYGQGGSTIQQKAPAAPMSWAPIMGAAYYTAVNQWSHGEYIYANNSTQDDIAIISTKPAAAACGFMNDGIGNARASAVPVAISGTAFVSQAGFITSSSDANFHRFVLTEARTVAFRAEPAVSGSRIPDLNIALEVQSVSGGTLAVFGTGSVALASTFETLAATGTLQTLASGTYFIKINGCGFKNPYSDGFSNYGSTGQYVLKGGINAPLSDAGGPSISAQPSGATLGYPAPATLTLSVTAAVGTGGAGPLTYLWFKDNKPLVNSSRVLNASGTSPTLTITNPVAGDAGSYFVLVTDANGLTIASQSCLVTVGAPSAPGIVSQPASILVSSSFVLPPALVFTVSATSSGTVYYQWLKDGIPLNNTGRYSGVATGTLSVGSVIVADSDSVFSVRAFNAGGSVLSNGVRLIFSSIDGNQWALPAEGAWDVAANWSFGAVPDGASNVYINGGASRVAAGVAATAATVRLGFLASESGALIVGDGGTLTVNSTLQTGVDGKGTLSIEHGGGVIVGGVYAQNAQSALSVTAVPDRAGAYLTAQSATLSGTFIAAGYAPSGTIVHTTGGISGTFASTSMDAADYISGSAWVSDNGGGAGGADYVFTQTLAWTRADALAGGTFTLPAGAFFEISTPLATNTSPAINPATWDGNTLTKLGAGTLILAAGGSYTGTTNIRAGALTIGGTLAGPVANYAATGTLLLTGDAPQAGALANNNVLDFNSPDAGPYRTFTIDSLAGSGTLRMKFDPTALKGDQLVVLGVATGTQFIDVTLVTDFSTSTPPALPLVTIKGANTSVLAGVVRNGETTYNLQRQADGTFTFTHPAATLTWLPTTGTAAWDKPANWSPNLVPDLNDSVFVGNSSTAVIGAGVAARDKYAYVTYAAGKPAAAAVTDDGQWKNTNSLRVGYYGDGALDLSGNAIANINSFVYIAYAPTATGLVTIRDAAQWNISSDLYVSGSGAARLDITGYGTVRVGGYGSIGLFAGGTGQVNISGNALWEITGNGYFGDEGNATLDLSGNAIVRVNGYAEIGNLATASGQVNVRDDAYWEITGAGYYGDEGRGALDISGSAIVNNQARTYLGYTATGACATTVRDNALWTIGGILDVGFNGSATLAITGNATVRSTGATNAHLGSNAGATGAATVSGSALWDTGSGGFFRVGYSGTGKLTITDSGAVRSSGNTNTYIGGGATATGEATLNANALLETGTNFYIGNQCHGKLTVTDNAAIRGKNTTTSSIGQTATGYGEVTLSGSALWDAGAAFYLGNSGTGKLTIADNARATTAGAFSQNAKSTLTITPSPDRVAGPCITARSAALSGTLVVDAYAPSGTIIHTTGGAGGGITGKYATMTFATIADYISGTAQISGADYIFTNTLTWLRADAQAHGAFTVDSGTYTVPAPLANNTVKTNPAWDGKSLTKLGAGTLILAPANTYTGSTTIQTGVLVAGALAGPVINSGTLRLSAAAAPNISFAGALTNNALLDFDSPADGPYRTLTVASLAGAGALRMTINPATGESDHLIILGAATGAQTLALTIAGDQPGPDAPPLSAAALQNLITVGGANTAAFTGSFTYGAHAYTIQQQPNGAITLGGDATPPPPPPPVITTITITLDPQGGAVTPATLTGTASQPYGPLPTPTKTNNLFDGWWTTPAPTATQITATTTIPAGATDHTLYAKWIEIIPPAISWAPGAGDQTVPEGTTATFAVNVTAGTEPLTYTWSENGSNTPIPGATAATYTTPATNYAADNGAIFKVTVINTAGTASLTATLTVTPGPASVAQQIKTQLETPGSGTVTITGALDFSLAGGVTIASGNTIVGASDGATIAGNVTIPADAKDIVIMGLTFDGANGAALNIAGASDISVTNCTFTDSPVTITDAADNISFSWNKFTATTGGGSAMTITDAGETTGILLDHNLWGDGLRSDMPLVTNARVNMFNNYFVVTPASSNTTATIAGAGAQILAVNNIYQDVNNPLAQQNTGLIRAYDNFITPASAMTASGTDIVFVPAYSQVMQSAPLNADTLATQITIYAGNTNGEHSLKPAATKGAARITATVTGSGALANATGANIPGGGGFTLTASATGFTPIAWQWYRDNFAITAASATTATYAVANATATANAGAYSVALTTSAPVAGDIVTAGAFTVSVGELAPPVILAQPASKTVSAGASATFTVVAAGNMLTYQWQKAGATISGATAPSYTIPSAQQADATSYTVIVENPAGTVTSDPATLTVNAALAAPVITKQPVSQTVTVGGSATFSVTATGDSLKYQWRKDGAAISGATAASCSITNAQQSHAGSYTVIVSNDAGSKTSDPATLTVNPANNGGNGGGGSSGGSSSGGGGGGGGAPSLWWIGAIIALFGARASCPRKKAWHRHSCPANHHGLPAHIPRAPYTSPHHHFAHDCRLSSRSKAS